LQAAGCTLVEMKDSDKCCGMAGAFGVKYSEISLPMLQEKLEHIAAAQADIVAAACPACMMQLRGGMDQSTEGIPVRHVADILAEHLPPRPQNV
jgi:Fe-S oxidoreductase